MTNVQVGISTVPTELIREMLPLGVSEPPFTITVQAPGVVTFSTPVAVSYPNVDNAAPGTKMLFISFDHATGRLVIDGTATVSADGRASSPTRTAGSRIRGGTSCRWALLRMEKRATSFAGSSEDKLARSLKLPFLTNCYRLTRMVNVRIRETGVLLHAEGDSISHRTEN